MVGVDQPEVLAVGDHHQLHLGVAAVPVVLLHGTQDETVPPEVSRSYAQRMQDRPGHHAAVQLVMVPDCEHFGLIDPDHPAFATVLATARTLAA